MLNNNDKKKFLEAVESLKKYRRADLVDDKNKSLIEKLYVDLLPDNHVLNKSLLDNTTYLVGRKGTGKSTIFLRIERELRKNGKNLPCYIDVKTVYESAQTEYINLDYLNDYLSPKSLQKYLIERSFLQNILISIIKEIKLKYDTTFQAIIKLIGKTKAERVQEELEILKAKIEDNEILKEIEIPVIKNITSTVKNTKKATNKKIVHNQNPNISLGLKKDEFSFSNTVSSFKELNEENDQNDEIESTFSSVLMQVFQIKSIITDIKNILIKLDIKHIVVLLDDFSEIDDYSIKNFVDVILAPLNNWSDEFIKFKIAAYPNRLFYGGIDPGKVDIINLDFYSLYSEFDRVRMEEGAIDFTRRLIEKRINYFTNKNVEDYFDISRTSMNEYYELIFQSSMNVPRIIGYILSYCYQSKIIYNKRITKIDIESSAQKYYEDKISPFFHKTTYSLMSIDEKIDIFQLRKLLASFTTKLTEVKRKISTGEFKGDNYISSQPFSSHFHFSNDLEKYLNTLELNYFISKYTEMSDKDGHLVSVYAINYGLAMLNNLIWGKPKGGKYAKYFQQRAFNFTPIIKNFLVTAKTLQCTNSECNKIFGEEQKEFLQWTNYKCNVCGGAVEEVAISEEIADELKRIENKDLLPPSEISIIMALAHQERPLIAKEIAEELDISSQSIAQTSKMMDLKKGLIKRNRNDNPLTYELTELAKTIYK